VRLLLILLLPGLLSLFGLVLRAWMSMRMAERERIIDAKVTSARSSPVDADEGPAGPLAGSPRRNAPPCGRYNLHLLFRLVGGERSCRHCAAIERARYEADAAAAVDAAEQALRGDRS
jgi:hypothetical protein